MQFWVQRDAAQTWINGHPCVKTWLARHVKMSTQDSYGHAFYIFTRGVGKSPEELLEMRKAGNGWNLERMIQDFVLSGTYQSMSKKDKGRMVEVGKLSKSHRESVYVSVRDFFAQTYDENGPLALPQDKAFKIQENEDRQQKRPTYIHLNEARRIISKMKEPYETLFKIAMYGGMGRGEMLLLNKFWPSLRRQLKEGKDPIRIDFSHRKTSEHAYFTLAPAALLKPYEDIEENPFKSHDLKNGGLKPIAYYDPKVAWDEARKRAKSDLKYAPHLLRDLFITGVGHKAEVPDDVCQFLTGHTVDRNFYNQLREEPEIVIKEWEKIRTYLDSGVENGETRVKLAQQAEELNRMESRLSHLTKRLREANVVMYRCPKCGQITDEITYDIDPEYGPTPFYTCSGCGESLTDDPTIEAAPLAIMEPYVPPWERERASRKREEGNKHK